MAQGAQVRADNDQGGNVESRDPVEHRMGLSQRHHDAADAFDQSVIGVGGICRATEINQAVKVDGPSFPCRRHVRRQGGGKSPRRHGFDVFQGRLPAKRTEQDRAVALFGGFRRKIADHRFQDLNGRDFSAQRAGQAVS